jgi:hypothetical protein
VLGIAAREDSLVVTHDPVRGLPQLYAAAESRLGVRLPAVSVVSTAVLERARHLGLWTRAGESPGEYYRRIAAVAGELPELDRCWRELGVADGLIAPDERLIPALATYLVYQCHFGGRLLGSAAQTGNVAGGAHPPMEDSASNPAWTRRTGAYR